jgi:hypothetical protein
MEALQFFEMPGQQAGIVQKTLIFAKTAVKISNFAK